MQVTTDLPVAIPYTDQTASDALIMALYDMGVIITAHPAFVDKTEQLAATATIGMSKTGTATLVVQGSPTTWAAQSSESDYNAETDYDQTEVTISFAAQNGGEGYSDDVRNRDLTGEYDPQAISRRIVEGWPLRVSAIICTLSLTITAVSGTTTDPTTWETVKAGVRTIETATGYSPSRFLCVLSGKQMNAVIDDIETMGGVVTIEPERAALVSLGLGAYVGTYRNIDFWRTDHVDQTSNVHTGFVLAENAICYGYLPLPAPVQSQFVIFDVVRNFGALGSRTLMRIEEIRSGQTTKWKARADFGAAIEQQKLCCRVRGLHT